jgi:hypothetical protein
MREGGIGIAAEPPTPPTPLCCERPAAVIRGLSTTDAAGAWDRPANRLFCH